MRYLTPGKNYWACDIESDGLLGEVTQIWCVTVENILSGETHAFTSPEEFRNWISDRDDICFVGHNFIAYDSVVLNRLWGTRIGISQIIDTFVLSQLYNPSMSRPQGLGGKKGAHSLEAWGLRLSFPKQEFSDFSRYTEEMLVYCANDTRLTALLYRRLAQRMRQFHFSETGCEIEHLAWNIIQNKQKRNGFPFDFEKAHSLYVELKHRQEELENDIRKLWPPVLQSVGTYRGAFLKSGEDSKQYLRHRAQFPRVSTPNSDGTYEVFDYVCFNLGSPTQRIEKLLELGWEPVKFTKKTDKGGGGNPQVDEESLLDFAEACGRTEVAKLAKWIVVASRSSMVKTWMDAYDERTGSIHGNLFIASTLRYRHSNPNSANIPAVRSKKDETGVEHPLRGEDGAWTYECRDLWTAGASDEWVLVGIDGKGIQLRVLANYCPSDEFISRVLAGDPHTKNIEVLGLANKPAAKKFLYTTLMGGGGAKLAADQLQFGTRLTENDGNRLKNLLIDSVPGFRQLIDRLKEELKQTGRIVLCDKTPILVPSPHMVIPYLLQGDESRLMKKTAIFIDQDIRRAKLQQHVLKVADIHDEHQYRIRKEVVPEFLSFALPAFVRTGEFFNYKLPIEGDAKVGSTWAMTH